MTKYVTQPEPAKAWCDPYPISQSIVHPTVMVAPPIDTKLLDQDGRRLYRVPDEIGFVPRRTRD